MIVKIWEIFLKARNRILFEMVPSRRSWDRELTIWHMYKQPENTVTSQRQECSHNDFHSFRLLATSLHYVHVSTCCCVNCWIHSCLGSIATLPEKLSYTQYCWDHVASSSSVAAHTCSVWNWRNEPLPHFVMVSTTHCSVRCAQCFHLACSRLK